MDPEQCSRTWVDSLVGCCGWPEAKARYFDAFGVVELQSTFYEPPSIALAEKWRANAPDAFRFCMKAWQLITHTPSSPTYRKLKSAVSPTEFSLLGAFRPSEQVWLAWERTAAIAHALRAAVIVFQCPKSFEPNRENIGNVRRFFHEIGPQTFSLAWEPRGDWDRRIVADVCREHNLIHCVDPFQSEAAYGSFVYWRLHGIGGYRYRYSDVDLQELQKRLLQTARKAGKRRM